MRIVLSVVLVFATAMTVVAGPMSAEAFDTYTRGKTLFYTQDGQRYGAEIYKENRRVTWSFLDGECKDGYWYNDGPVICFVYEDAQENPQCWTFELGAQGLTATFVGEGGTDTLYEALDIGEKMVCLGPKIGV